MSEDNEVKEIQEKKIKELKPKAAAVIKEREQVYEPERVLFALMEYMENTGLNLMNTAKDLKQQIINYKQGKINQGNK